MSQGRVTPLLAALVVLAACSVDRDANPAPQCGDDDPCPSGMECYRGFCLEPESGMDAGMDASADGAPPDGGPCGEPRIEECYEGDPSTENVGACRSGQRECLSSGEWSSCIGQRQPADEETCNGIDDDCNGVVDDVPPEPCADTGLPANCGSGVEACGGGEVICLPPAAQAEICNELDDDCDGEVNEDTSVSCWEGGDECTQEEDGTYTCAGVCQPGRQQCVDGELGSCTDARLPGNEECTSAGRAADEDCDGQIDEGCACTPGATQDCYPGPDGTEGVGTCAAGTQTCNNMMEFGDCEGAVVPEPETCANHGEDNDCDGNETEMPDGIGDPCVADGAEGICREGEYVCEGGALVCDTPGAGGDAESECDGLDDDCDGSVDEDWVESDPDNCGFCGNRCTEGFACCSRECIDTSSHPQNCGSCGNTCSPSETCCGGECVNTNSNEQHCGDCDSPCTMLGLTCQGGQCLL